MVQQASFSQPCFGEAIHSLLCTLPWLQNPSCVRTINEQALTLILLPRRPHRCAFSFDVHFGWFEPNVSFQLRKAYFFLSI